MMPQIQSSSAACFSFPPPTPILTTLEFAASFSIARHNPVFFAERTGDAMEKVTWSTVIILIGQGTGKVCIYLAARALLDTDFDFSSSNQYIASSSMDKTVRIWEISKGLCICVLYGLASQFYIRFHPMNNNFLSVGNANREVTVFNFSTGRIINKITFDNEVTAMDHDHTGQLIFCGDAQGCVSTVSMDSRTDSLSRSHRNRNGGKDKSPVTTMQYRTFDINLNLRKKNLSEN